MFLGLEIAGQCLILKSGRRYLASRKPLERPANTFKILITEINGGNAADAPDLTIGPLTRSATHRFVKAFNDCPKSFVGRVWE